MKDIVNNLYKKFRGSSSAAPKTKPKKTFYEELPEGTRNRLMEKQIVKVEIFLGKMDRSENKEIGNEK
jgi:hypothetical protein